MTPEIWISGSHEWGWKPLEMNAAPRITLPPLIKWTAPSQAYEQIAACAHPAAPHMKIGIDQKGCP
jgi:hypothetical protein